MADRFDIASFSSGPEHVARLVRAEDVFSFMSRQVSVPASCVALVWGESGQPAVVRAGQVIESHGARELLFVRTVPFFLDYGIDGLESKDGYAFAASVRFSIQVVPDRAELAAFRKSVLGSGNEANTNHLRRHCEEAIRTALSTFAQNRAAADLVSAQAWSEFDDALVEHFRRVGFASGLAMGPDPRVTFESAAYAESRRADEAAEKRRKRQQADEQLRDVAAKAREKHLAELGSLLEQVKRMAGESPGAVMADLIKTFDPAQRGSLYEGLVALHRPARRTEAIVVVAGEELLWFEPSDLQRPKCRQRLKGDLGPLRSIRIADTPTERLLLVGAQEGVYLVEEDGTTRGAYKGNVFSPGLIVRGGFNAAVLHRDEIFATHSELGLITWPLASPDVCASCLDPFIENCKAIRDLQADESGWLWFSADERVVGVNCSQPAEPDRQRAAEGIVATFLGDGDYDPSKLALLKPVEPTILPAPADVTALLVADGSIFAGLANGGILRWSAANLTEPETVRGPTARAVRSLGWLSGGGIPRLLIADGRLHLDLQVLGDAYRGEYRYARPVRWGFAGEDLIVGVDNQLRDRLLIWRLDQPTAPAASISMHQLGAHAIQDVALLPAATANPGEHTR